MTSQGRLTRAQLPKGVRDLFGEEAFSLRQLEWRLLEGFRRWGYRDVVPPTFELHENTAVGLGEALDRATFKFVDPDGALMALRADFTNGIARLLATKLADEPRPVRICYGGTIFRNQRALWGKQREFHQAGVELVGAETADAEVEVLALALETLAACGLRGYRLNVGHVGLFKSLFAGTALSPEDVARVREAIDDRDRGRVGELCTELAISGPTQRVLLELPSLIGGRDVLARAHDLHEAPEWRAALARLDAVLDGLAAIGHEAEVLVDLGEVKGIEYYTGVLFEGFVPGCGFPVLSGGRYDNLHAQFGRAGMAVGLAFVVERLMLALTAGGGPAVRGAVRVAIDQGVASKRAAHQLAGYLRAAGADVRVMLPGETAPPGDALVRGSEPTEFVVEHGAVRGPLSPTPESARRCVERLAAELTE